MGFTILWALVPECGLDYGTTLYGSLQMRSNHVSVLYKLTCCDVDLVETCVLSRCIYKQLQDHSIVSSTPSW